MRRWREPLLALALGVLALTLLAGAILEWVWPAMAILPTVLTWAGMVAVCVYALTRSRPVGLFRFHPLDVLYGVVLGVMLRMAQGWTEVGLSGRAPFPSFPLVDGRLGVESWLLDVAGAILIGPTVEEFFFRVVILVTIYNLLRRPFGRGTAGAISVLASSGVFVIAHVVVAGSDASSMIAVAGLGLVCGLLVVLTGRVWAAVITHSCFNASYVLLAAVGTVWG